MAYVAKCWLKIKRAHVTSNYADDIYRSLELHIFPAMGKLPIHKIKAANTIAVIKPIAAKGSLETVKRLCQRLNEVMTYAVNTGLIEANPLAGIRQAFEAPQKQNMPTIKPEQLPAFMPSKAIEELVGIIGRDNALALANHFPGRGMYIPQHASSIPCIVTLLGTEVTQRLCDYYQGDHLYLPARKDIQQSRNRWIVNQHQAGIKVDELVQISGVSRRQIFNILRNHHSREAA